MRKRLRSEQGDEFQAGIMAVDRLTGEKLVEHPEQLSKLTKSLVSQIMATLARKGGKMGGKRRAANMTDEQRYAAASMPAGPLCR